MRPFPRYVRPLRYGQYIGELTKKESCLPESYIEKYNYWVAKRAPKLPQFRQVVVGKGNLSFSDDRPWSHSFISRNKTYRDSCYTVKPLKEWIWFKGDVVEILVGKDKGKQGNIFRIFQERNWVLVNGLNMYMQRTHRYFNDDQEELMEAPLLVGTHVSLVDPADLKPTKVEWRYTEEGNRVRVSLRTGRIIPIPVAAEETYAYKTKAAYNENDLKDTKKDEVVKATFVPELKTFEMDIMEKMNITEDRTPVKTYWC